MVQQPSVCAPAPALYPHQIAYQQQQLSQALQPPQQLQMPQQVWPPQQQQIPQQLPPAPHPPQMQARPASWQQPQRAGSYDSTSSALQPFVAGHSGAAESCAALCIVSFPLILESKHLCAALCFVRSLLILESRHLCAASKRYSD